jgi:cholesterol transport system auxiliary component
MSSARMPRLCSPSVVAVAVVALLSGCGPLVQVGGNAKPPAVLLSLSATVPPLATAPAMGATNTLMVITPTSSGTLQTLRLPVTISDTEIKYLAGATWAEQPNRLFRRVLADTLAAHGAVIVDPRGPSPRAARTLSGSLVEFGLDVREPSEPRVHVRYDATLSATGAPLAMQRFDANVEVASQSPTAVAAALNVAANTVAKDVAAWAINVRAP